MTQIDFHKQFPGSGKGKIYPWLWSQIQQQFPDRQYDHTRSFLDWGAGQGGTAEWLHTLMQDPYIECYDPYVERYASTNYQTRYFDCVYSCDVLEHVPREDCIAKGGALAWMNSCSRGNIYLIIDLTPAKKTLSDGTNAHVNLQTPDAWIKDIELWMTVEATHIDVQPDKTYGERNRLCVVASRGKKM